MRTLIFAVVMGLSACTGSSSDAELASTEAWELVDARSSVLFEAIKNNQPPEIYTLDGLLSLTGHVSTDGQAIVQIILDGVQTDVEIRNRRMRQHLFQTNKYPFVTVTAHVDMSVFQNMEIGSDLGGTRVDFSIEMHGVKTILPANIYIRREGVNEVRIETATAIVIDAQEFDMLSGIEKLRDLANLDTITPTVDVNFSLVFER